jgi:hypothetical protein
MVKGIAPGTLNQTSDCLPSAIQIMSALSKIGTGRSSAIKYQMGCTRSA